MIGIWGGFELLEIVETISHSKMVSRSRTRG